MSGQRPFRSPARGSPTTREIRVDDGLRSEQGDVGTEVDAEAGQVGARTRVDGEHQRQVGGDLLEGAGDAGHYGGASMGEHGFSDCARSCYFSAVTTLVLAAAIDFSALNFGGSGNSALRRKRLLGMGPIHFSRVGVHHIAEG